MNSLPESRIEDRVFQTLACAHCGEDCPDDKIRIQEHFFCCQGCQSVYSLLQQVGLCDYYKLNEHAGTNKRTTHRKEKFAFLEDRSIQNALIDFEEDGRSHVQFYIPIIHCSSCIYLLENLHHLLPGVIRTDVQFLKKEVAIVFDHQRTSLRQVVEMLTDIGYEPHISLGNIEKRKNKIDKSLIYQLGVAGFCFGNIMLISVPEYFSSDLQQEAYLATIFRYLSVALALPVFFYSAQVFFKSAWNGIRHKHLNIDAPVALAILVTFVRSLVDVFYFQQAGFFDSMAGIVFFMLIGRALQNKTYGQLSFERDYTDYFPIAATVLVGDQEKPTALPEIQTGDVLLIHSNELVPADGIILKGRGKIDYSFVTGESVAVEKEIGELVYAGGRQVAGSLELLVSKPVAQSYLTGLWNKNHADDAERKDYERQSFVHRLARNFTWVVLLIAAVAGVYWSFHNPLNTWVTITAVLIIACPCALLLTSTFTDGYLIRIFGKNGLYLRNAGIIEALGKIDYLVFDKTGTLTSVENMTARYEGEALGEQERSLLNSLTKPSLQSMKDPIRKWVGDTPHYEVQDFQEHVGLGAQGRVQGRLLRMGTAPYFSEAMPESEEGTTLFLTIDGHYKGRFILQQGLREGIPALVRALGESMNYALISGDRPIQRGFFADLFGEKGSVRFEQKPHDKLAFIEGLQEKGHTVAMIGDGLNDAVALKQSDVGICLAEDINNFSPAADAILTGAELKNFDKFVSLAQKSRFIKRLCFAFSLIYNITGIFFAVQGLLSPLVCAILMPSSTLTIVLITYFTSKMLARRRGMK